MLLFIWISRACRVSLCVNYDLYGSNPAGGWLSLLCFYSLRLSFFAIFPFSQARHPNAVLAAFHRAYQAKKARDCAEHFLRLKYFYNIVTKHEKFGLSCFCYAKKLTRFRATWKSKSRLRRFWLIEWLETKAAALATMSWSPASFRNLIGKARLEIVSGFGLGLVFGWECDE